jgi:hypothetical protein
VAMETVHIPFRLLLFSIVDHTQGYISTYGRYLDSGDFGKILFIVDAIAQNIPKGPQSPFETICCSFFLGLFEGCSLAFAIFNMAIANVLESIVSLVINHPCSSVPKSPHGMCHSVA